MSANTQPFISICIPAYKRTYYLKRLLQSIATQTFRDFEVVIGDDSNDDSVADIIEEFEKTFIIRYYRNEPAFGMPANWNFAISKASGEWIKLMHDDDWFLTPGSLQRFADATKQNRKFIFSGYTNFFEENGAKQEVRLSSFWKNKIRKQPAILFAKNVIGPPSVTLVHNSVKEEYDERLKWRVDTDFYERVLRNEHTYDYIDKPLIGVGISELQVTQSCLYKPEVELPEGLLLLEKYGVSSLKNILVYDAWWRLLRNMNIKSKEQLLYYTNKEWPNIITALVSDLSHIPAGILKTGVVSKFLMSLSYLKNFKKI